MYYFQILFACFLVLGPIGGSTLETNGDDCLIRKEWRNLTQSEQLEYIDAVKCLQTQPSKTNGYWEGAKSVFDDFQGLHISQTDFIHYCGQFLPWHRYFMWLYEQELRSSCNYTGAQPYWDWTLDAQDSSGLANSPVWDPVYGLGGNGDYVANVSTFPSNWVLKFITIPGRTGGGCVSTGPFVDMTVNMGVGNTTSYTPHCLHRDFSGELFARLNNATFVDFAMASSDHWWLSRNIEGYSLTIEGQRFHGGGHLSVGGQVGDMTNRYSSAGDPIFYLHHTNIDRVWASWQRQNWPARKHDIGGPAKQFAYPYNFFGDIPYQNVTLQTPLHYTPVAAGIRIEDVMDMSALNYEYDEYY